MLFGNKKSFAIEYNLNTDYGGEWLFGKICYWIDGSRVGDYDLGTSLRDVLIQAKYILNDAGNRFGGILCEIDNEEAFMRLDKFFYNEELVDEEKHLVQLPDQPARFIIKIPVDIFDNFTIFLIQCDLNSEIIIFKSNDKNIIHKKGLRFGEFDNVFHKFFDSLNDIYENETKRSS
jgi:hypothetical protein